MIAATADDLASYLGAIEARLEADLDADLDRSVEDLREVQRCTCGLLTGGLHPEQLHEDWPRFFRLVAAFVLAHGSPRLCRLQKKCSLFEGWGDDPLTDYDRAFLESLSHEVDGVLREGGYPTQMTQMTQMNQKKPTRLRDGCRTHTVKGTTR